MRNDHKGKVDTYPGIVTFYASGERGDEVRADGKGGVMARGYYGRDKAETLHGPFRCRRDADRAAYRANCEAVARARAAA